MSIKDLFNRSSQIVVSSSLSSLSEGIESAEYMTEYVKEQGRLEPHIDFGDPSNFTKYGSAQEYYEKSIEYIYGEYPYDGSLKEKIEWRNNASLLDLYILDNRYPKSTGYVVLSSDAWGVNTGSVVSGYGAPAVADNEYINLKGGPNSVYGASLGTSSLSDVFGSKSNVFDQTVTGSSGPLSGTQESNLRTDLDAGVTVEFWLKTGSLDNTLTEKQVVFDMWNGQASSSADYGRLRIEIDGTRATSPFMLTLLSGTVGLSTSSVEIGSTLDKDSFSDWGHYAFSFVNSGNDIVTRLYVNGSLSETITTGSNVGEIRKDLQANIGSLLTGTFNMPATAGPDIGWGKLSGSIDEFRFWKTRRTEKQIGRYYITSEVGAGTNTDTANIDLGVYYKFNEGITEDTTIDNVVLDYSGRISNGTWTGYPGSTARNTGSAIVSASVGTEEPEPIIRSIHPDVIALNTEFQGSGSIWDYENNSSLYYTMPSWIIDEDEGNGTGGELKKLTQIMASYLDNLDILVGELPKLNVASYPSGSTDGNMFKPYPYAHTAVRSFGLEAPELFSNGDVLEYYLNRNETKQYEEDLSTVKNLIYNNIYNNLVDIYKSKGTEKAFRNLIRCFGIGDDVIRINAYADNATYKFETKRRADSYKTKAINFNNVNNFAGTVYQYADTSNPNSVSYISGSSTDGKTFEDGFPITLEAEVVFPKKISRRLEGSGVQEFNFLTSSLFGMHTAIASSSMAGSETDLTWAATDNANLQVYAIKDTATSDDIKFVLTSSVPWPIPELSSSYYQNTYNNEKWNFAVRLKPQGYPQSFASGTLLNNYIVEFYGVSYIADRKVNEFILSGSVSKQAAENFLIAPKRVYVGSHKENFTGSTLQYADSKITSCRYWFDYLDNAAIQNHALDPANFGHPSPNRDTYLLESDLPSVQVPEIESLALYWDFQTVTGSDNGSGVLSTFDGKFTVQDVSSGSLALTSRYNWLGKVLKYQHTGRGDAFRINDTGSIETQYLYSARQQLPEVVFGDDNIRVLSQEETEVFTRETRPTKTYYAFEKSMYQVISDEIINYFGSIAQFNNLIGQPINRYRQEYKDLKYLRQFFFERVGNTPDLDKFVDYYKWIDSTLETMLMQLVPAAAQVSDGIDNVIESHVLERSKYHNKFPTLELNIPTPETGAIGINRLLYNWKRGHHPISNLRSDNCFYWDQRAERTDAPLSSSDVGVGNPNVNSNRQTILNISLQTFERKYTTPYQYSAVKTRQIHGGINYSENKKIHFYRGVNYPHGAKNSIGVPVNTLNAYDKNVRRLKDCDDEIIPNEKKKYSFGTFQGTNHSGTTDGLSGDKAMPFNIYSASQGMAGYNRGVQLRFLSSSQLTNLHSDGYGNGQSDVPMQGPFTKQYVGGHQSRHVRLNTFDAERRGGDGELTTNNLDGQYTRPESWRILLGGGPEGVGAIGLTGPDYGGPYPDKTRYRAWFFREGTTKRPVNIKNILQTTASADSVLSGTLQHGAIGNYDKTYQIVQTSGRSTNNFWFNDGQNDLLPARYITNNPKTTNVHTLIGVRPEHGDFRRGNTFLAGTTNDGANQYVIGLNRSSNLVEPKDGTIPAGSITKPTVFALPDRTKQDAVIVERFSAPGGPEINSLGFLDVVAAEKSVYNALPFRNLSVRGSGSGEPSTLVGGGTIRVTDHLGFRRGLRTLAALHAGPFGTDGTYGDVPSITYSNTASFYKVNRNVKMRIEGEPGTPGSSYSTASVFDNWYIQHPIPQNDFQYAWISASFSGSAPIGHAHRSGFASGTTAFVSAIDFLTASDLSGASKTPVDFAGLNIFFHVPTGSFNELSSSGALMDRSGVPTPTGSINTKIDFLTQDANGEHLTNGYILHLNRGTAGFSSWKQINNQYHPLVRHFKKNNTYSIIDPQTLLENQQVTRYNYNPKFTSTDQIFGVSPNGSEKPVFKSEQNREVLEYHEPAVTINRFSPLVFEYNSPAQNLPSVKVEATYGSEKNYFANSKLTEKLKLKANTSTAANLVLDITKGGKAPGRLSKITYSENVYPSELNIYKKHISQRTNFGNLFWRNERIDRFKIETPTTPLGHLSTVSLATEHSTSIWPLDARLEFAVSGGATPADWDGLPGTAIPRITTARDDCYDNVPDGRGNYGGGEGILQNCYVTFHTGLEDTGGGPGARLVITASCLYNRRHGLATGSSVRTNTIPFGGPAVGGENQGFANNDARQFSGDAPWDAANQSGKYPAYDSYDDYIEEMKVIGKGYSILPEYRMSDRMDAYIVDGVDKFDDAALFSLTGALESVAESNQADFYKIYSHSDFAKFFDVAKDDIKKGTTFEPTALTVRCKAMLKLLPYDGFYPASRTVQLSQLFSQSVGSNMTLGHGGASAYKQSAIRPFYSPMIAPGVLFNSIKSGIAVDYPVLTGSVLLVTSSQDKKDYYINNDFFDYRVPFEALVEPENHIANITFFDMEPHPSASLVATGSWDGGGDQRFKLAMNNFLAETPEFFLQDGNLTSFVSSPEENFKKTKANRVYTMKVTLGKSYIKSGMPYDPDILRYPYMQPDSDDNMIMYSRPSAFGPPVYGALSGTLGAGAGTGGPAAPIVQGEAAFQDSGSQYGGSAFGNNGPFTPPYWNGAAYAIFTFTPLESKKYTLDEIQASASISYHRYPNWNFTGSLSASGPMGSTGAGAGAPNKAEDNSMQISASLNLFGRVSAKDLFKFQNIDLTGGDRWAIQTKFETPILNFIDVSGSELTPVGNNNTEVSGGQHTRPYGMWHQYGRLPKSTEGIYLEISKPKFRPSGNNPVANTPKIDLSLADLIGFKKSSEKLGKVANTKTIREAVVAVPFVEKGNQRKFFKISKTSLALQSSATTGETIVSSTTDSVQNMFDAMGRYVFPPSFDYLTYPEDVDPVSMYIFEFEHTLTQEDLTDIWQNLPPRIARSFDSKTLPVGLSTDEVMQTKEITHALDTNELLRDMDDHLQWMVFKVKQKAKRNYFEKIVDTNTKTKIPAELDKSGLGKTLTKQPETDFLAGGATKGAATLEQDFKFSYNWPYDFFSLVELVKLDEDIIFGEPLEKTELTEVDAKVASSVNRDQAVGSALGVEGVTDIQRKQTAPATVNQNIALGSSLGVSGVTDITRVTTPAATSATAPAPTTTVTRETSYGTNITREGVQVPETEVADSVNKTTSATSTITTTGVTKSTSKSTGIKK